MKRYHVFVWWLHPEMLDRVSQAYCGSTETIEQAQSLAKTPENNVPNDDTANEHCDIFETQDDGSLKLVMQGNSDRKDIWTFHATS